MASLTDILASLQQGVVAVNNFNTQVKGSFTNIAGQFTTVNNTLSLLQDNLAGQNILINGGTEVSQENGSNVVSFPAPNTNKYVVDGWLSAFAGTNVYTGQQIGAAGMPTGTQLTSALEIKATTGGAMAATDYIHATQPIEGYVFRRAGFGSANAQSITVGFWMAATINGQIGITISNGAGNRHYCTSASYTVAPSWQWMTVTVPPDVTGTWATDNSTGALFTLFLAAGASQTGAANAWSAGSAVAATGQTNFFASTNNVVDITGAVILIGAYSLSSASSPLLQRSFPVELGLCQRYYEKTYNYTEIPGAISSGDAIYNRVLMSSATVAALRIPWHYKVRKRANPTLTWYSPVTGTAGKVRDFSNNADVTATNVLASEVTAEVDGSLSVAAADGDLGVHGVADARL